MTTLREAAQQALEALEIMQPEVQMGEGDAAIKALKAALAEPVQEPVAWVYTGIKQDGTEHGPHLVWKPAYMDAMSASKGAQATPLYTAPPQRKPLSEEEIDNIWDSEKAFADIYAIARAIERARGIV